MKVENDDHEELGPSHVHGHTCIHAYIHACVRSPVLSCIHNYYLPTCMHCRSLWPRRALMPRLLQRKADGALGPLAPVTAAHQARTRSLLLPISMPKHAYMHTSMHPFDQPSSHAYITTFLPTCMHCRNLCPQSRPRVLHRGLQGWRQGNREPTSRQMPYLHMPRHTPCEHAIHIHIWSVVLFRWCCLQ